MKEDMRRKGVPQYSIVLLENSPEDKYFQRPNVSMILLWCLELVYNPITQSLYLEWIKLNKSSSLDLERVPVFSPLQEAGNGSSYMKVERELRKEEVSPRCIPAQSPIGYKSYRVQGSKQDSVFLRRCGLPPNLGRPALGGSSALRQRTFFFFSLYFGKFMSNILSSPRNELSATLIS